MSSVPGARTRFSYDNSSLYSCVIFTLVLSLLGMTKADAHETGMSAVQVLTRNNAPTEFHIELNALDLELAIGLDNDGDGSIRWNEFRQRQRAIAVYIQQHLTFSMGTEICASMPVPGTSGIRNGDVIAIVMTFTLHCPRSDSLLEINNRLLQGIDSSARVLLSVKGGTREYSVSLGQGISQINLTGQGRIATALTFVWQGIHHILIGIDHLAFLLILLLPVARVGSLRTRLLNITGIVTSFTLAHSVTLTLAAMSRLNLPAGPVEITIAGSIVFAALVNILFPQHRVGWLLAYVFGLVHGFGFAGALGSLDIASDLRLINLLAFNLGVELGQLLMILIAIPVLTLMGNQLQFRRYVLPSLSLLVAFAGAYWMIERVMQGMPVTG